MEQADVDTFTPLIRAEVANVMAHLVRLLGDLERAEDVFQESTLQAMRVWAERGLPDKPGAWLMTTARNRAIDELRKRARDEALHDQYAQHTASTAEAIDEGAMIPDDRLRLVFACAHPELNLEGQVALTLRLVAGLSTAEVARAFLVSEPTIAQRLVRAKRTISERKLPYVVPEPDALAERLASVLQVIYLVFNEGYTATSGSSLTRVDLMEEALRLSALVTDLLPEEPEARGLLALLQLLSARADTRVDSQGALVLLEDQDRTRWNRRLIAEGLDHLRRAARAGVPGPFQLRAHLAAAHAEAPSWEATDWPKISALYEALEVLAPSPVVTLNRAVAVAMVEGPAAGLALLEGVAKALAGYHLLPATRADFLRRLQRTQEAAAEYRSAIALASNEREREFLQRRLAALGPA